MADEMSQYKLSDIPYERLLATDTLNTGSGMVEPINLV